MNIKAHTHLNTSTSSVQRTLALKYILSLLFCLWAFGFSWGQALEWAKGIGRNNNDYGYSLAHDSYGNVYMTGYFQGTVDFDPGAGTYNLTSAGSWDVFISKFDAIGNLVWAKRIGGTSMDVGSSIVIDKNSNIYVIGYFKSTVDFNPGIGVYNLTSPNNPSNDVFILKLDNLGNFIWAKRLGGNDNDVGLHIAIDNMGNVITTGYFEGTSDFDPGQNNFYLNSYGYQDIFISKLDSMGNFIWAKQFGGSSFDYGKSLCLDGSGNIYITGNFTGTSDFNADITETFYLTSASSSYSDIFISKLDALGNFVWAKRIGGVNGDSGNSIVLDSRYNIYLAGYFNGIVDFDSGVNVFNLTSNGLEDIFISKMDTAGNLIWAKKIGGSLSDYAFNTTIDKIGNIYVTGEFQGTADFNTDLSGVFYLTSKGITDVFITKLDSLGQFVWANRIGGANSDRGYCVDVDESFNVYTIGCFRDTINFERINSKLISYGGTDVLISKIQQKGITGYIFNDLNQNCISDSLELGIQNRYVSINPGNIIAQTNESGVWVIDSLSIGTYTATIDTSGNWSPTCPVTQTFTVTNSNEITYVPDFGLVSTQPCASPDISVNMPFIRPCVSNQKVYVNTCNQYIATGALNSAYADLELDSLIIPQSASLAYTSLGNNTYRFQLGNLNPGQCKNFTIDCQISCNALLGQTLCMEANLYPADSCVFDTIPKPFPGDFTPCTLPWDKSSLSVKGWCQNDSIYFSVCNSGQDMDCYAPVRIYIDGVYTTLDSLQLVAGACFVYSFAGDGRTWRLEADQHPLHPGNSHPNATVEACGDLNNWTPDLVNVLPQDDADPIVDIYCGVVTGSYDPNDKTGYPTGLTNYHYIMPNQQLQYVIRFQNTGTDTAFTIVVRDTLDIDLDIFSVVPGVASHTYNFQMYGPRVLEWTFYNIQLPDSNHSEPNSHGFCTFTVNQNHDLPNNTKITNSADIYFDYNAPVITNQTTHTVNDQIQTAVVTKVIPQGNKVSEVLIYPNPATDEVFIESSKPQVSNSKFQVPSLRETKQSQNSNSIVNEERGYRVFGIDGKKVFEGKLEGQKTRISTKDLESGVYFIEVIVGNEKMTSKLVITK